MAKQDDYIKTALRMPKTLHARLAAQAEAKGRSLNAEFIACLELGLEGAGAQPNTVRPVIELDYDELVDVLMRKARDNDELISIHASKNVATIDVKSRTPPKKDH
ncbi:Arc family DNA-binding protein [Janthinobacterium sp. GB4P2]|uniref:Arc family DNA-binding protein n=1 Tax=Janthinobacterium sp. GB4P2 TaxID=3424189 RepID=UPI003F21111D